MPKHSSKTKRKVTKEDDKGGQGQGPKKEQPHPLHIPMVIDHVVSYLSITDLLRARLVCRQWKEEASKYLENCVLLKLLRNQDVTQIMDVMKESKRMFGRSLHPFIFDSVHLEASLSPNPPQSKHFHTFFTNLAPNIKSLSINPSNWNSVFPLDRIPLLQQLTIHGNLSKRMEVFPSISKPYLNQLEKLNFHLNGRIKTQSDLQFFASNIISVVNAAPNLEEIIAPKKKMDHRNETVESYLDMQENHILFYMLFSNRNQNTFRNLVILQVDAELRDYNLNMLAEAGPFLPKLETLGIILSGASTRRALIPVLRVFSKQLKHLSISYSKTHGPWMNLTEFFLQKPRPFQSLLSLTLKNYPASVNFLGVMKQLLSFTLEVRNITDCFSYELDCFILRPNPHPPSSCSSCGNGNANGGHGNNGILGGNGSSVKTRTIFRKMNRSEPHCLKAFHYIHNKEGSNNITLFGDRCNLPVTLRIALRFPLLSKLTLDNMTGESMAFIIKYLPLLEELNASGGFYNDLSIVGATTKDELKSNAFPACRKLPFIGDLVHLHTLSLATFSTSSELFDKADLLSDASVYHGLIHCKNLRHLTLGADNMKNRHLLSPFETNIGDNALKDLIEKLNLVYLKTVRCPLTKSGFQDILQLLKDRGITYSINNYEGPILPDEFNKKQQRFLEPQVQLEHLNLGSNSSICNLNLQSTQTSNRSPSPSPNRKRKYGQ